MPSSFLCSAAILKRVLCCDGCVSRNIRRDVFRVVSLLAERCSTFWFGDRNSEVDPGKSTAALQGCKAARLQSAMPGKWAWARVTPAVQSLLLAARCHLRPATAAKTV